MNCKQEYLKKRPLWNQRDEWLRSSKQELFLHKTRLWFPAPWSASSQPAVTDAPGKPIPSSGLKKVPAHTLEKTSAHTLEHSPKIRSCKRDFLSADEKIPNKRENKTNKQKQKGSIVNSLSSEHRNLGICFFALAVNWLHITQCFTRLLLDASVETQDLAKGCQTTCPGNWIFHSRDSS